MELFSMDDVSAEVQVETVELENIISTDIGERGEHESVLNSNGFLDSTSVCRKPPSIILLSI